MKRIVLFLLIVILLSGCVLGMDIEMGWYNINNFVMPDDSEFLALIEELNTPFLIIRYMIENFEYKYYSECAKSPYQLWKDKKGDCNDFALFFVFIAHYHGIDTWQIRITFIDSEIRHWLGVYKMQDEMFYNFTDKKYYGGEGASFEAIVIRYCESNNKTWKEYEVYDYNMDIIEEKTQP